MTRSTLAPCLAIAGTALALASAWPAQAAKSVPAPQIAGVDAYCSGFTSSIDKDTGGVVYTCVAANASPGAPTGCGWSDLGHALTRFLPGTDAVQT